MYSSSRTLRITAFILLLFLAFPLRRTWAQYDDGTKVQHRAAASMARDTSAPSRAAKAQPRDSQTPLPSSYGKLPLSFEANEGQTAPEVNFLARGAGYIVFLTPSREVLSLKRAIPSQTDFPDSKPTREYSQAVLELRLLDSNTQAKVSGVDQLPGISNYFIGNDPAQWHTNIPNYGRVVYRDIYPGVDVSLTTATKANSNPISSWRRVRMQRESDSRWKGRPDCG